MLKLIISLTSNHCKKKHEDWSWFDRFDSDLTKKQLDLVNTIQGLAWW